MRVGILGGTFNPVHVGHLRLAEGALKNIPLDQVMWVPALVPPHKTLEGDVSSHHRARMVELAIEKNPSFRLSRVELERGAPSYTIDTVRQLQKEFKDQNVEWFLLIGSDTAGELSTWRQIQELRRLVHFVAVPRPGGATQKLPADVQEIPVATLNVSSSDIRQRVRQGRSIEGLVPEAVRRYIQEHQLYQ